MRDPARHGDLGGDGVAVVAGDVTDADRVATVAAGHDAAISAVYDAGAVPDAFYTGAAQALLDGLGRAGVGRLLVVGISVLLETAPGVRVMDAPDFPPEYRPFCLGHAAGLDVLRAADTAVDWLVMSPAGDFDRPGARTGRYRISTDRVPADYAADLVSCADFAMALLDEVDNAKHHRTQVAVTGSDGDGDGDGAR